jgi:capsular polysaccharide biosynthesis protein
MKKIANNFIELEQKPLDDELSIFDVIMFIRRNFYVLLSSALLGACLGFVLTFVLPAEWEASGLIRIGQLGRAGSAGASIEPALQVADRLKSKSFQNEVLKELKISTEDDNDQAENFRDQFKVKLEKSDLINLSIRAGSRDEARRNLKVVAEELKFIHLKISAPTVDRWRDELNTINNELNKADVEAKRLNKSLAAQLNSLNALSFSQTSLLSSILITREAELRTFRDTKNELEEQLSPERTFPTGILGNIEVSRKPVFPKKSIFVSAGFFLGLLLAFAYVVVKNTFLVRKD